MSCSYDYTCCTANEGKDSAMTYDNPAGFVVGQKPSGCAGHCGPTDTPCHNDVIQFCTKDVSTLFSTDGFCLAASRDPVYGPTLNGYKAMYCAVPGNYEPHMENGSNNGGDRCSQWWATDSKAWGLSDASVSDYCTQAKNLMDKNDLSAIDKGWYQQVCGCVASPYDCPQAVDVQCAGGQSQAQHDDPSKTQTPLKPAYHTFKDIAQQCPPITVCNQFSTIGDDALVFGAKTKQKCEDTVYYATAENIKFIIIFIIFVFVANLLFSVYMSRKSYN